MNVSPNPNFLAKITRQIPRCLILFTAAFTEFQLAGAEAPVNLGQAFDFGVLAGSGITNTGATTIFGDVGSLPTSTITGFGTVTLTGTNHAGDATTLAGKGDLLTAYNDAAGRLPTISYGPIFDLGGLTLAPGVHSNSSSFGITGPLTLDALGDPNAIWIFQAGSTLITSVGSMINLINGAQAGNIFWQVGSSATLGVNSAFSGTIMAATSITLNTGAHVDGRALALNGAVTMDSNTINVVPLLVGPTHWLGATSGLWTSVGNWASDSAGSAAGLIPSVADDITFSATGAANQSTTLGANFAINTLTINDTAAVTIAGANTLSIGGNAAITVNSGAGLFTVASNLAFTGAAPTVTVSNAAGALFSGVVGGTGSLTKAGAGTLTLSGVNNYSGGTTINAGRVVTQNSSALGSGAVVLNAGVLAPAQAVNVQSLNWAGGNVALTPASGDVIHATNAFTNGGGGGAYQIGFAGLAKTTYTLTTFGSTNFSLGQFSAAIDNPNPNVVYQHQFLLNPASVQLVILGATATGTTLQNSAPVNIPTFADYTVTGPVTTGTPAESNTINSLIFSPGSTLQVFNQLTVTSGVFDVTTGSATINGGTVVAPGGFSKNGAGTLGLTGIVNVTGSANINSGTLNIATGSVFTATGTTTVASGSTVSVIGSLVSPAVNVLLGSNLDGSGSITGAVTNFGTVNPGNAVGALNIVGSYTQGGSGLLVTQLVTPANHDQLIISGAANLGGTLQIITPGGARPAVGSSFDIVNAGSVNGTFGTVINPFVGPGTLVKLVVDYTPTTVLVNAVQNSFQNALSLIPLTPNQTATAGALDSALTDVRQTAVLDFLNNLNINAVPHQLDKIAPEELTAIYSISFAQLDTEVLSVQQRLASIRNAGRSGARSEAPALTSGKDVVLSGQISPHASPDDDGYGFFANATGQYASLGDTSNANGFDVQSVGTTMGGDVRVNENWVLGVTLGYARSNSDLNEGGSLEADGVRAAVYAMYERGEFYTELMVGGSYNSYDTTRSALGGIAQGSTNSTSFDAYLGTGYDIHVNQWTITPMASLLYSDVHIDGFDESGSLQPLSIDSQNQSSLRSRIGVRAAYTAICGAARVTPSLSLQWQHEFLDNELAMRSRFANGAGSPFTVHGPETGRDSALVTAGVNVAWSRYAIYLAYQAELGRRNYENHTLLAGFRVSW
jgi:fibronectin-binding autotransporter adhesin